MCQSREVVAHTSRPLALISPFIWDEVNTKHCQPKIAKSGPIQNWLFGWHQFSTQSQPSQTICSCGKESFCRSTCTAILQSALAYYMTGCALSQFNPRANVHFSLWRQPSHATCFTIRPYCWRQSIVDHPKIAVKHVHWVTSRWHAWPRWTMRQQGQLVKLGYDIRSICCFFFGDGPQSGTKQSEFQIHQRPTHMTVNASPRMQSRSSAMHPETERRKFIITNAHGGKSEYGRWMYLPTAKNCNVIATHTHTHTS